MARYIREVELNRPDDFVQYIMTDFLSKHGFKLVDFKGEQVYRAGGGIVEMPKFLSWGYWNGVFHVEAWTRNCWLPGVYGAENAMTGFMGCVPKSTYKKDIEALIGLLYQPLPQNAGAQPGMGQSMGAQPGMGQNTGMPGQPAAGYGPGPYGAQPVLVRGTDTSRYAIMAFVFALIGLIVGILVPLIGILFGALGITYGGKGKISPKKGMATAGFVIGIIAIVLSVVVWGLNLFLLLL